jgi:hypothetical protein
MLRADPEQLLLLRSSDRGLSTVEGSRKSNTILNQGFLKEGKAMDNFTFGVTMMVCGMGGTILTLYILSLIMRLLGKFFPEKKEGK